MIEAWLEAPMKTASGGEKSDRVTRPSFFVTFSKSASRAAREAKSNKVTKNDTSYPKKNAKKNLLSSLHPFSAYLSCSSRKRAIAG